MVEKEEEKPDLLPDIEKYLEDYDSTGNISLENLEELIFYVRSKTGLEKLQIESIVKNLFKDIRTEVLSGNKIEITKIGRFWAGDRRIIFKPIPTLKKKIKDGK